MLATIGPTRTLANGQSYEEVNGDISPDEGFEGNDEDFYNKDKMFDYWHEVPEEGPKGDPGPGYGQDIDDEEKYKRDKIIYEPEGYIGYNAQLDIPMYMQKTEDFGGPACAEMVLDYILGPVNNQETYAEDMGTDHNGTEIHNLVGVLNKYQDYYHYDKLSVDSKQHLVESLMYSLDNNVPAIVDISTQGQYLGGNWLYSMPGHYVVVSGLRVDDLGRTYVLVQDPYLIGPISVDLSTFYQMLTEHWDRAIIY